MCKVGFYYREKRLGYWSTQETTVKIDDRVYSNIINLGFYTGFVCICEKYKQDRMGRYFNPFAGATSTGLYDTITDAITPHILWGA